jgi:CBS domain-containing protein
LGNGISEGDLLVHDATSTQLAYILSSMEFPQYPAPTGVIRDIRRLHLAEQLMGQVKEAQAKRGVGDLNKLYRAADLWTVTERKQVESDVAGEVSAELDEEYVDELDKATAEPSDMQDRLITTTIAELKPRVPITIEVHSSLERATRQMKIHNIGALLVTDAQDKLVGIFTERDVLTKVAGLVDDLRAASVLDYMTPSPITIKPDQPIAQALHLMSLHGFRHLPLVDDQQYPTGIISFRDVVGFVKRRLGEV